MTLQIRRCFVDDTILLVMSISRWLGLAPVRFTRSRDKICMYISRTFIIYGLIFIIVFDLLIFFSTYLEIKSTITDHNKINDTRHTHFVLKICDILVSIGLLNVGVISATRKTNNLMCCVESVRKIKNNIIGDYQHNVLKWKILSMTVPFIFGTWILKTLDVWRYYEFIDLHGCIIILTLTMMIMMELQFVVIALCIKSGFQAVNECLRNVISNLEQESSRNYLKSDFLKIPVQTINAAIDLIGMTDQRYPDVIVAKRLKLSHKVREISRSYVGVCDVLRDFNDSESTTMFLQLMTLTLHIIVTIFNLVKTVHTHGSVILKPDLLALQCAWFVYHVIKMILVVEPCCRTEGEVANTRILVGKLMCHITSEADPLRDETEAFYNHILLNDVSYTVFGIFSLGRPLISKVIGGVTTILVLLF